MILNRKQAEAIDASARALTALDATLQCVIPLTATTSISVSQYFDSAPSADREVIVDLVDASGDAFMQERYATWDHFRVAYGMQQERGE